MTATTTTALDSPTSGGLRWAVKDAMVLTGRNLRHTTRQPELLFFSTVQPVIFVLLFRYVFGGAIATPGLSYVNFLMAGIFVQTTAFASTSSAVGLATDLSKGIVDRFRSLPMARSAVLAGRTLGDLCRIVLVVLVMTAVGLAVGLRPTSFLGLLGAIALTSLFGFAFSWIQAFIGLSVPNVEAANLAGFVWLFPLTFALVGVRAARDDAGLAAGLRERHAGDPDRRRRPGAAQRGAAAADAAAEEPGLDRRHHRGVQHARGPEVPHRLLACAA